MVQPARRITASYKRRRKILVICIHPDVLNQFELESGATFGKCFFVLNLKRANEFQWVFKTSLDFGRPVGACECRKAIFVKSQVVVLCSRGGRRTSKS